MGPLFPLRRLVQGLVERAIRLAADIVDDMQHRLGALCEMVSGRSAP